MNYFFFNKYNIDIPVTIHNSNEKSVVDVGSGFNPRLIADVMVNNYDVYEGKKTIMPFGRFYKADICALPFKDKSFDIAIANHVFEHLKKPKKAFLELNRIAKKVLVITPSAKRESKGTDFDHFWFVYGCKGKYVFEAIPKQFKHNYDLRVKYKDKFIKLNNELENEEETVYYQDSIDSSDIIEIRGEIDEERYSEIGVSPL